MSNCQDLFHTSQYQVSLARILVVDRDGRLCGPKDKVVQLIFFFSTKFHRKETIKTKIGRSFTNQINLLAFQIIL